MYVVCYENVCIKNNKLNENMSRNKHTRKFFYSFGGHNIAQHMLIFGWWWTFTSEVKQWEDNECL